MKRLCGSCERIYDESEAVVKMLEAPPDAPIRERGVTHIPVEHCPYCGSPEHSYYQNSQWQKRFKLQTYVELKEGKVLVSTVNLMMEHSGGFFETMIFGETVNLTDGWCERYWTKDEAVKRHHEIVEKLKNGRYRLVPVEWKIELVEEDDPCEGCKDFGSWYCKTCCPCRADWEDEEGEHENE
jgi:hypothetical protein